MKKLLYVVMLLLGLSVLASCEKDGGEGNNFSIIGKWSYSNTQLYLNSSLIEIWSRNRPIIDFSTEGKHDQLSPIFNITFY